MPFDLLDPRTIAGVALADVQARFAAFNPPTRPSQEQWLAIASLLECLQAATDTGTDLEPALYLSPIPCGVGKSQTIAAFARTLAAAPDMDDVGMLILVNRINEARDTATELQACRSKLCVLTSDSELNALGDHKVADQAQICVATQESLRIAMKHRHDCFADCETFTYRWSPRAVRVWDESFRFNRPVTVDSDTLLAPCKALQALRQVSAKAALKVWSAELDKLTIEQNAPRVRETTAPDLRALGVDFDALEAKMDDDDGVHLCQALALVSGNKVSVTRGSFSAATVITHYPEIPRSLMPLIITDASALVNTAYKQMAAKGTPLVWLKDAGKTYVNMVVRLVSEAASRSQYRKTETRAKLLDGVVRYIRESDDHVLVFGYKGSTFALRANVNRTLKAQLQHRLGKAQVVLDDEDVLKLLAIPHKTDEPDAVQKLMTQGRVVFYLTHGRGTATNFYRCIKRVCLMGLDFPPGAVAHATSGAAQGLDLVKDHPTESEIGDVSHGMLLDRTLQPALRGAARLSQEGDCMPMELVVFQHPQTGLAFADYSKALFPGCRVVRDTVIIPPKAEAQTHLQTLIRVASKRLKAGETVLSFVSLREALDCMTPNNFTTLIRSEEWTAFITDRNLTEVPIPTGSRGKPGKGYALSRLTE